jgi:hypothetical protein
MSAKETPDSAQIRHRSFGAAATEGIACTRAIDAVGRRVMSM